MELDKIKDIIIARWKFIASNAAQITNIAQAEGESDRLDYDSLEQITNCMNDLNVNLASLKRTYSGLKYGDDGEEK